MPTYVTCKSENTLAGIVVETKVEGINTQALLLLPTAVHTACQRVRPMLSTLRRKRFRANTASSWHNIRQGA